MVGAVQTAADRAVKERERRGGTKKHVGSFVYSAHSAQSRPKNMSQLADLENICPLGYNHFQKTVLHVIASPSTYLFNFDGGGDLLRSVPHIKFGDKIKSHRYLDHSG